jgi:hypothetical protein
MLSIGLAYFVTLCLYPGIEAEITSCNFGTWMPVLIMAVFNGADLLGKVNTQFFMANSNIKIVEFFPDFSINPLAMVTRRAAELRRHALFTHPTVAVLRGASPQTAHPWRRPSHLFLWSAWSDEWRDWKRPHDSSPKQSP